MVRDIQKELQDLEDTQGIKLLGIDTYCGTLSRPVVETAIDSLKDTLAHIDLDEIAKSVDADTNAEQKDFAKNA